MERTDFEQWKPREVARLLALLESQRRYYQDIVASLPVALAVISADRWLISANRAFRQTFEIRADELSRTNLDRILPSDQLIEKIRDVHVQGRFQADLFLAVRGRSLRVAILPIRNGADEIETETLIVVEDVGALEQMRAEAARTPRAAAPGIAPPGETDLPVAIWQADSATRVFTAVSGVETLLGYPGSHWLESPHFFTERIHPEDRAATVAFYEAIVARGGDGTAEYRSISASGDVIWCRETIRVHADDRSTQAAGSAPPKISGVIANIGRRKQLEQQSVAAERTLALHGLASRLAHDLNNPLMIITGYAEEILNALAKDDPMRADVEQLVAATERISGLTTRLLEFTRRPGIAPHPVELARTVSELQARISAAAGETVQVELQAPTPVWAMADPDQLDQIILALISAAREGAPARITLSCDSEILSEQIPDATLKPGTYACVTIHADGKLLDARKRAALFEPFLTKEPGGGLDLARAYALVRNWGGDIAVSSGLTQGSAFMLYLPYHEPETAAASSAPTGAKAAAADSEPQASRPTILVVDDEPEIRALVRKILRRERFNVLEAVSAEEALKLLSTHRGRLDLLLTDIQLPGLSGLELAGRVLKALPQIKVIYISGHTDDESARRGAFPAGASFLQKPFTLSTLVGKVRAALGNP